MEMNMMEIMIRDQRTTSHRVLNEINLFNVNDDNINLIKHNKHSMFLNNSTNKCENNVDSNLLVLTTYSVVTNRYIGQFISYLYSSKNILRLNSISNSRGLHTTTWLKLATLLVIFLAISVQGAPTHMNSKQKRFESPQKWLSPCGSSKMIFSDYIPPTDFFPNSDDFMPTTDFGPVNDLPFVTQVIIQAQTALDQALTFREEFVERTFGMPFEEFHKNGLEMGHEWMPVLPKTLGEDVPQDYYNDKKLDDILPIAYEALQKFAVGLEEVVWYLEDERSPFAEKFADAEFRLKAVLCELQTLIIDRGVPLRPDIVREDLPPRLRHPEHITYEIGRNWIILRDYMNGLEFLIAIMQHYRKNLSN